MARSSRKKTSDIKVSSPSRDALSLINGLLEAKRADKKEILLGFLLPAAAVGEEGEEAASAENTAGQGSTTLSKRLQALAETVFDQSSMTDTRAQDKVSQRFTTLAAEFEACGPFIKLSPLHLLKVANAVAKVLKVSVIQASTKKTFSVIQQQVIAAMRLQLKASVISRGGPLPYFVHEVQTALQVAGVPRDDTKHLLSPDDLQDFLMYGKLSKAVTKDLSEKRHWGEEVVTEPLILPAPLSERLNLPEIQMPRNLMRNIGIGLGGVLGIALLSMLGVPMVTVGVLSTAVSLAPSAPEAILGGEDNTPDPELERSPSVTECLVAYVKAYGQWQDVRFLANEQYDTSYATACWLVAHQGLQSAKNAGGSVTNSRQIVRDLLGYSDKPEQSDVLPTDLIGVCRLLHSQITGDDSLSNYRRASYEQAIDIFSDLSIFQFTASDKAVIKEAKIVELKMADRLAKGKQIIPPEEDMLKFRRKAQLTLAFDMRHDVMSSLQQDEGVFSRCRAYVATEEEKCAIDELAAAWRSVSTYAVCSAEGLLEVGRFLSELIKLSPPSDSDLDLDLDSDDDEDDDLHSHQNAMTSTKKQDPQALLRQYAESARKELIDNILARLDLLPLEVFRTMDNSVNAEETDQTYNDDLLWSILDGLKGRGLKLEYYERLKERMPRRQTMTVPLIKAFTEFVATHGDRDQQVRIRQYWAHWKGREEGIWAPSALAGQQLVGSADFFSSHMSYVGVDLDQPTNSNAGVAQDSDTVSLAALADVIDRGGRAQMDDDVLVDALCEAENRHEDLDASITTAPEEATAGYFGAFAGWIRGHEQQREREKVARVKAEAEEVQRREEQARQEEQEQARQEEEALKAHQADALIKERDARKARQWYTASDSYSNLDENGQQFFDAIACHFTKGKTEEVGCLLNDIQQAVKAHIEGFLLLNNERIKSFSEESFGYYGTLNLKVHGLLVQVLNGNSADNVLDTKQKLVEFLTNEKERIQATQKEFKNLFFRNASTEAKLAKLDGCLATLKTLYTVKQLQDFEQEILNDAELNQGRNFLAACSIGKPDSTFKRNFCSFFENATQNKVKEVVQQQTTPATPTSSP